MAVSRGESAAPDRLRTSHCIPGGESGRPRPLKIESAEVPGHVHHLADKKQPRNIPALHCLGRKLIRVHPARRDLRFVVPFGTGRRHRPSVRALLQFADALIRPARAARSVRSSDRPDVRRETRGIAPSRPADRAAGGPQSTRPPAPAPAPDRWSPPPMAASTTTICRIAGPLNPRCVNSIFSRNLRPPADATTSADTPARSP